MAIYRVNTDDGGAGADYSTLAAAFNGIPDLTEDTFIYFSGVTDDTSLDGFELNVTVLNPNGYRLVVQGNKSTTSSIWDNSVATISVGGTYFRNRNVTTLEMRDVQYDITGTGGSVWGYYASTTSDTTIDNVYFRAVNGFTGVGIMSATTGGLHLNRNIFHGLTSGTPAGDAIRLFDGSNGRLDMNQSVMYNFNNGVSGNNNPNTSGINSAVFGMAGSEFVSVTGPISYCATDNPHGTNNVNPSDWNTVFTSYASGDFTLLPTDTQLRGSGSTGNNIGWDQSGAAAQYTLTYNAGANGSISGVTPQVVPSGTDGSAVTAVPDSGYVFDVWSDAVATATRQDTNVSGNITVTASFAVAPITYTLTYTAGVNGSISGVTPQVVASGASGSEVFAIPSGGYLFDSWSDDYPTYNRTDTNVSGNISVTANFILNNAPISNNNYINVDQGSGQFLLISGQNTVLWNDTDPESGVLTAHLINDVSYGTLNLTSSGTFLYTHNGTDNFTDQFQYRAFDGTSSGNLATAFITINRSPNPVVVITSPASGTYTNSTPIAVAWTVNDVPQTSGLSESLTEGSNVIVRSYTDSFGHVGSGYTEVILDTQDPVVVITSPASGYISKVNVVPISWTVDSIPQTSGLTEFLAQGSNVVTRVYTDLAGNSGSDSIEVIYNPSLPNPNSPTRGSIQQTIDKINGVPVLSKRTQEMYRQYLRIGSA